MSLAFTICSGYICYVIYLKTGELYQMYLRIQWFKMRDSYYGEELLTVHSVFFTGPLQPLPGG